MAYPLARIRLLGWRRVLCHRAFRRPRAESGGPGMKLCLYWLEQKQVGDGSTFAELPKLTFDFPREFFLGHFRRRGRSDKVILLVL